MIYSLRHNICLKPVLYFCKRTVLKVLCYQNIYLENHGRHAHCGFVGWIGFFKVQSV